MRIAILGANGQLAFDLKRALEGHDLVCLTRSDFDVTDGERMRSGLEAAAPEVIVNTTAFHRVDDCESRIEEAFRVNAIAVLDLARVAASLHATLVHLSTDYVFDGAARHPYTESSPPGPRSVYANSKLAGEHMARSAAPSHLVVRTCGLYGVAGSAGKGGNFVETMIRKARAGEPIRVVSDQVVTPTPTRDLAAQLALLIESGEGGLFHATAQGSCSWYEFAKTILEMAGLEADLEPTTARFHRTPAERPAYSVLENARLGELGLDRMRGWREGLAEYLRAKHGFDIPAPVEAG